MPAMPAAWRVEMKPQTMADAAMRAMMRAREGASAESTPIWMPSEPRFANPQSAYDAIVYARAESGSSLAVIALSAVGGRGGGVRVGSAAHREGGGREGVGGRRGTYGCGAARARRA